MNISQEETEHGNTVRTACSFPRKHWFRWIIYYEQNITSCCFHWKGLQTSLPLCTLCIRKRSWSQSFLNLRHCLCQWTSASLERPGVDNGSSCCQWHSPEKHQFCSMAVKTCHSQNRNRADLRYGSRNAETLFRVRARFQVLMTKSAKRQRGCSLKPSVCW